MRRRIDLAVALITEPQVLFVDEPTTGLDPLARTALWEQLRSLVGRGHAVVLTTQYLEEADALADDVVILREGAVVASGTAAELKALAGQPRMVMVEPTLEEVYRRLYTDERAGSEASR
jgi:ABC-2 type transport system ATP-binding protein